MPPAGTETTIAPLEFVVAEEAPKEEPKKETEFSPEAQKRIEIQKDQALEVFRNTPKEIEEKFGLMVLERVFPELQMDDKYMRFLLEGGEKNFDFLSNVTGDHIPAEQIYDHWILPRGEQVSKSTGALYIPEDVGNKINLNNSFLSWEFNNLKKMIDSDVNKPQHEQSVIKVAVNADDNGVEHIYKRKMTSADLFDTNLDMGRVSNKQREDLSKEASVFDEIWEGKEMEDVRKDVRKEDIGLQQNIDSEKITTLATGIVEIPQSDQPEMGDGTFVISESSTTSELPIPIDSHGVSIKEKLHRQLASFFPENDAARENPNAMLTKYPPVLISQDLIILSVKNKETGFKYFAYARVQDKETPLEHKWIQNIFRKSDDVPLQMTQWLAGLEQKNDEGKYESGFDTAALTV